MNLYWFYDIETNEDLVIESDSISGAIIRSLEMVLDGTAKHPVYVGMK